MVAASQLIVGHQGVEVVDVVIADIAREPMEDARKFVIRAALHGGADVVPFIFPLFVGGLVLVLYVEKPDGNDAKTDQNRQLNQQKRLVSQKKDDGRVDGDER